MTLSLILACLWVIAASVAGMLPSKRSHWPAAFVLIATGLPLLGFVWVENGWLIALLFLAAAVSILRWPVMYLGRWIKARLGLSRAGE